jgi:hypothetical protein
MSTILFSEFNGEAPKVHPLQLAEGFAQKAENVRLDRGRTDPILGSLATGDTLPSNTQSMFLYLDQYWFTSPNNTYFVEAPIATDPQKYVVFNGSDYPRITRADVALASAPYPSVSYRLGVPGPITKPTVIVQGTPPVEPDPINQESVVYVFTYCDSWGRESIPSLPSTQVDLYFETQNTQVFFPTIPSGNALFDAQAKIRLYRSNTGTDSDEYQFVKELPIGTADTTDQTASEDLSLFTLPSTDWDAPPDDNTSLYPDGPLNWMGAMPNGFLAGTTLTEICFSERAVFHAWPVSYRYPIKHKIVGAEIMSGGVAVLTDKRPFAVLGSDPASMSIIEINREQSCESKKSIVSINGAVLYASPDGLVAMENTSLTILTEGLLTQTEWQQMNPSTMKAYNYEGKYVCFYDNGGFIFDPRDKRNALVFITQSATAGFYYKDNLYLSVSNNVVKFDKDDLNPQTIQYKTRRVQIERAINFALMKVTATQYPVEVTVTAYYNNEQVDSQLYTVENGTPVYMHSGFLANQWEINISGNPVMSVALAESFEEL